MTAIAPRLVKNSNPINPNPEEVRQPVSRSWPLRFLNFNIPRRDIPKEIRGKDSQCINAGIQRRHVEKVFAIILSVDPIRRDVVEDRIACVAGPAAVGIGGANGVVRRRAIKADPPLDIADRSAVGK